MNIQNELAKHGLVAVKSYNKTRITVNDSKTGETRFYLEGKDLVVNNTPEKTWDYIKTKIEENNG